MYPPVAENVKQNYFIDRSPEEILKSGEVYDVPWISGIVSEEGLFLTAGTRIKTKRDYVFKYN